jgi:hypothetical protein
MNYGTTAQQPARTTECGLTCNSPGKFPSTFSMQKSRLIAGRKSVFRMLVALGLTVLVPSLYAQQNKAGSDSPQAPGPISSSL